MSSLTVSATLKETILRYLIFFVWLASLNNQFQSSRGVLICTYFGFSLAYLIHGQVTQDSDVLKFFLTAVIWQQCMRHCISRVNFLGCSVLDDNVVSLVLKNHSLQSSCYLIELFLENRLQWLEICWLLWCFQRCTDEIYLVQRWLLASPSLTVHNGFLLVLAHGLSWHWLSFMWKNCS